MKLKFKQKADVYNYLRDRGMKDAYNTDQYISIHHWGAVNCFYVPTQYKNDWGIKIEFTKRYKSANNVKNRRLIESNDLGRY